MSNSSDYINKEQQQEQEQEQKQETKDKQQETKKDKQEKETMKKAREMYEYISLNYEDFDESEDKDLKRKCLDLIKEDVDVKPLVYTCLYLIEDDEDKSKSYLKTAVKGNCVEATYELGLMYYNDEEDEKAIKCLEKSANTGHYDSIMALADIYMDQEDDKNYKKAKEMLLKISQHPEVMLKLAKLYSVNYNDPVTAGKWYNKVIEHDCPAIIKIEATFGLAYCAECNKDFDKARELYGKIKELIEITLDDEGKEEYENIYNISIGDLEKEVGNESAAVEHYMRAYKNFYPEASIKLALHYESKKEYTSAEKYLKIALITEHPEAMEIRARIKKSKAKIIN